MARFCIRACGRLSTAAILIAIGIIQVIAGVILTRSDYIYLLSIPNFWTASGNIAVGCLLGISATTWKTIHKKSSKYAARRGLLASLAISVLLLNVTTAAMLIVDEGKKLLSIYLVSRGTSSSTLKKEIFAYAYATSVCSPIVCVVISIAFLIGLCCQSKTIRKKAVDLKNNLDEENMQIYSWVYTPKLPKPDPEVLRTALSSSESGSSSSESDSDSSSETTIRHSPDHSSDAYQNSQYEISNQSLLRNSVGSRKFTNSVRSNNSKVGRVSFVDEPTSEEKVHLVRGEEFQNRSCRNIENFTSNASLMSYERNKGNTLPQRFMKSRPSSKILFTEYPSGDSIHSSINSSELPRLSGLNQFEQETDQPLDLSLNMHSLSDEVIKELNNMRTSPEESFYVNEEAASDSSADTSLDSSNHSLLQHNQVRRTSTADHSKVQQELQCLEDSAIYFEPEIRNQDDTASPTLENVEVSSNEYSDVLNQHVAERSYSPGKEVMRTSLRHSNFSKRLPSKLIPVSTPVISDGHRYIVPSRHISPSPGKVKPYSKTKNNYNKYLQSGFSTFKTGRKSDEVDTTNFPMSPNSLMQISPMTSISEVLAEEINEFAPSTSTRTSGYMSTSYNDIDEESGSIQPTTKKKYQSLVIKKSEWTDIPLDEDKCSSFQSEPSSSSFDQTNDARQSRNPSSKKTPSSLRKTSQDLRVSII